MDGSISFSQQAGHFCNTGAEMQQRISGQGSLVKSKDVYMEEGIIVVSDNNDWVTAPDAIRNLSVTTAIKLCAPAKHEKRDEDIPNGQNGQSTTRPWYTADLSDIYEEGGTIVDASADNNLRAVSEQIWAVQVVADPGYSGQIDMAFEAANSNWIELEAESKSDLESPYYPYRSAWFESAGFADWPGYTVQKQGPWFVGSYFNIEQYSRTSQGTHRRYIDISSPWSHAYLSETMTVTGMSEVWEAFSMDNLTAGDEVGVLWWKLF